MQGIKGVKEFLLRTFFGREKLYVVNNQDIDITVIFFKLGHFAAGDGADKVVGKSFTGNINDICAARSFFYFLANSLGEVGFAQPNAAVYKEGIVLFSRIRGDFPSYSKGKGVVC